MSYIKVLKNCNVYAPKNIGIKDILIVGEKIVDIQDKIELSGTKHDIIDIEGQIVTSGLIDQHIHITGAGGRFGFSSMTPEIMLGDLIKCGTTSVVGLLGTDGATRSLETLYAKTKSLEQEGISAYMLTSYFGLPPLTIIGGTVQDDMIFIDKVIGCKVAISDPRCSFPTEQQILDLLRQVRVGGLIGSKKGVLHLHLGGLKEGIQVLLDIVDKGLFPIENISPTHCGRTKLLWEQSVEFSKKGGIMDISTGGSKFTDPHNAIIMALDKGVDINNITLSSDGNAGMPKLDENGNQIGFRKAAHDQNLFEMIQLTKKGVDLSDAIKVITTNPANNMGLKGKGQVSIGFDADLCIFNDNMNLKGVFARGKEMMKNSKVIVSGNFENI